MRPLEHKNIVSVTTPSAIESESGGLSKLRLQFR
jgi:hypothetical protein